MIKAEVTYGMVSMCITKGEQGRLRIPETGVMRRVYELKKIVDYQIYIIYTGKYIWFILYHVYVVTVYYTEDYQMRRWRRNWGRRDCEDN